VKPGDIVKFTRDEVRVGSQGSTYLRGDCVGIVIKKVRHVEDLWIVLFPRMGNCPDGYPSNWLQVIYEI